MWVRAPILGYYTSHFSIETKKTLKLAVRLKKTVVLSNFGELQIEPKLDLKTIVKLFALG
jgi:hypothetical protein